MTTILIHIQNHIATITLNRPEKHNALTPEMTNLLSQYYRDCENNPDVHVIILKANGKNFCAGADLSHMKSMGNSDFETNLNDAKQLADFFSTIYHCKKPTIACVQGSVRGGGIGLVAAHDIVIAENNATFAFTEVTLGLAPAVIAPFVLQRMHYAAAKYFMLTAEIITAQKALETALIDHLCDNTALETTTQTIVNTLLKNNITALENTKKWLQQLHPITQQQLDNAADLLAKLRSTTLIA